MEPLPHIRREGDLLRHTDDDQLLQRRLHDRGGLQGHGDGIPRHHLRPHGRAPGPGDTADGLRHPGFQADRSRQVRIRLRRMVHILRPHRGVRLVIRRDQVHHPLRQVDPYGNRRSGDLRDHIRRRRWIHRDPHDHGRFGLVLHPPVLRRCEGWNGVQGMEGRIVDTPARRVLHRNRRRHGHRRVAGADNPARRR